MSSTPHKYFAIFGAMRSGSNLLEQSLNQFPNITCHGELFNPSFIGHQKNDKLLSLSLSERERAPYTLIEAMIKDAGDGIAGFRIFQDHDKRTAKMVMDDLACAKIVLQRDPLQSFISLELARKTGQWLLHNAPDRRGGKIVFDEKAYIQYSQAHAAYYEDLRKSLQETGQTAFWLHYPEQKNLPALNGIAKYLGIDEELKTVKETIRRQNPGELSDKIENYEEMHGILGNQGGTSTVSTTAADPLRRANIPKMVTCISHPIIFIPTPGGPNEEVLRWMSALDGTDLDTDNFADSVAQGEVLHTGHSQRTLYEWMDSNPDVTAFTAVRHPVSRAYDVFMHKVFNTGPTAYDVIREQLRNTFNVGVPDRKLMSGDRGTLADEGYSIGQHRAAFHSFLRFLKSNLIGQTSIRIDGLWAAQTSFLAGFTAAVPISVICKEGHLDDSFRYIEAKFDIEKPTLGIAFRPEHMFSLDEIYARQTENLARKAYGIDYTRLGFDDYQAALDV